MCAIDVITDIRSDQVPQNLLRRNAKIGHTALVILFIAFKVVWPAVEGYAANTNPEPKFTVDQVYVALTDDVI